MITFRGKLWWLLLERDVDDVTERILDVTHDVAPEDRISRRVLGE